MDLQELRRRTYIACGVSQAEPIFWTDAEVNRAVNQGYRFFARKSSAVRGRHTLQVQSGVETYQLPNSVGRIYRAAHDQREILRFRERDFDRQHPKWRDEVGGITHYTMSRSDRSLTLYRIPQVEGFGAEFGLPITSFTGTSETVTSSDNGAIDGIAWNLDSPRPAQAGDSIRFTLASIDIDPLDGVTAASLLTTNTPVHRTSAGTLFTQPTGWVGAGTTVTSGTYAGDIYHLSSFPTFVSPSGFSFEAVLGSKEITLTQDLTALDFQDGDTLNFVGHYSGIGGFTAAQLNGTFVVKRVSDLQATFVPTGGAATSSATGDILDTVYITKGQLGTVVEIDSNADTYVFDSELGVIVDLSGSVVFDSELGVLIDLDSPQENVELWHKSLVADLNEDDEPLTPAYSHLGLVFDAASRLLRKRGEQQNIELATTYRALADEYLNNLKANSRIRQKERTPVVGRNSLRGRIIPFREIRISTS